MRGTTAIPLFPPSPALVADVPPYRAPKGSLVSGTYNVFREIDGSYRPRNGYAALQALPAIGARIHGGIFYADPTGDFQYVLASNADWYALIGGAWTKITSASANIGAPSAPARFAVLQQNGLAYAMGVDSFSPFRRWESGEAQYESPNANPLTITSIAEASGTTATVTLAAGVSQLAGGDSIVIAGNSVSGFNGSFTILQVLSPTSFTFVTTGSALGTGTGGTVTDNTIMTPPAANDLQVVSNRVVLVNTVENGTRYPRRIRWSASGDSTRWPVLAYIDTLDVNDQIVGIQPIGAGLAVVYGQRSFFFLAASPGGDANAFTDSRIYAAQGFAGPVSPAAIINAEGAHWYVGLDGRVYVFNGASIAPVSQRADSVFTALLDTTNAARAHGAYLPSRRQLWFFVPTMSFTQIADDPSVGEVVDLAEPQPTVLPPMTFGQGVTASFAGFDATGETWENSPWTWGTDPYTWDSSPSTLEEDMFIATAAGEVDLFFRGGSDGAAQAPIPWQMSFAPFGADPLHQLVLNRAEFWFAPRTDGGKMTAAFATLGYPFDPGTGLVNFVLPGGWTEMPVEPGAANPGNTRNNFLQLTLSGADNNGQVLFAGGVLYCFLDTKGEYSSVH